MLRSSSIGKARILRRRRREGLLVLVSSFDTSSTLVFI